MDALQRADARRWRARSRCACPGARALAGRCLGAARTVTPPLPSAAEGLAIVLEQLQLAHDGRVAVDGITGRFEAGSITAVVGPNGAGKSSLLSAIVGQLRPSSGGLHVPTAWRGRMAWLPQRAAVDLGFPIAVFDFVALGHWSRIGGFGPLGSQQHAQVHDALEAVGLTGFGKRPIGSLSAGQFQRLRFARMLLQDAPVLLLDEPFNAVDEHTAALLLQWIRRWHDEGRTVIAVLHDLELARLHFDAGLLLARRCIAWGPIAEVLVPAHLCRAQEQTRAWDAEPVVLA